MNLIHAIILEIIVESGLIPFASAEGYRPQKA